MAGRETQRKRKLLWHSSENQSKHAVISANQERDQNQSSFRIREFSRALHRLQVSALGSDWFIWVISECSDWSNLITRLLFLGHS